LDNRNKGGEHELKSQVDKEFYLFQTGKWKHSVAFRRNPDCLDFFCWDINGFGAYLFKAQCADEFVPACKGGSVYLSGFNPLFQQSWARQLYDDRRRNEEEPF
jgi:hypothetical protein